MTSFRGNIEKLTLDNKSYRKVLHTTKNMQLVLMSIPPGIEIGTEVHKNTSQFIRVEAGKCKVIIGRKSYYLEDGGSVIVNPGMKHNVISIGKEDLKMYTIYTPPEHPKNLIERVKK